MDCERFRSDRGAGAPLDDAGRAHVATCEACGNAVRAVAHVEGWLTAAARTAAMAPSEVGRSRTVQAVLAQSGERHGRVRPFATLRAAAVGALVAAGLLVAGFVLGRSGTPGPGADKAAALPVAMAEHEREIYRTISAGLGEGLGYVATVDGELVLGLRARPRGGDLRVVFLVLRDASGHVLARPRVVLQDGEEAVVRASGIPDIVLTATREGTGLIRVRANVRFEDGAEIAARAAAMEPGRQVELGEVATRDTRVSVLATGY